MVLVYATRDELVAYAPANLKARVPDEPEATRLLTSASQVIRRATKTAIYDTDAQNYPSDVDIRQAFRDATCAQALWWTETGDETGVAGQFQSMSIGSVSLSRGSASGAAAAGGQQLAPKAETELRDAGVLAGSIVQTYPWEGWF
ncbi:hypothetical protein [Amycolatopsis eburnea]|uniref:Head-to-tail adaptor n=1 Tax=Amycolatopsis eburnea TaxID=2267691 RepID=A0A3R9KPU0_9PSEU|nr:hypothetical protein [Amycolatopsis eburnea]RSD22005.1 hypothetical protein EIY87_09310 [Amycolatopsis eburnea]